MAETPWKRTERRIARLLGGERVGVTGEATPDVVTPWLCVEIKQRKIVPEWIRGAVLMIGLKARPEQLPIVVLTGPAAPRDLVIMQLRDFREWFGGGQNVGDETPIPGADEAAPGDADAAEHPSKTRRPRKYPITQ